MGVPPPGIKMEQMRMMVASLNDRDTGKPCTPFVAICLLCKN